MRKTPLAVTIVGYLIVIGSLLQLFFLFGAEPGFYFQTQDANRNTFYIMKWLQTTLLFISAIVGYKILSGANWARITLICSGVINVAILLFLSNDPLQIIKDIVVLSLVVYFLFFDRTVAAFFKKV